LPRDHPDNDHAFTFREFFSHIDIHPTHINLLDGNAPDSIGECSLYEGKKQRQVALSYSLEVSGGRSHRISQVSHVSLGLRSNQFTFAQAPLTYGTVFTNAHFFNRNISTVSRLALTVDVAAVTDSREVIVIVTGQGDWYVTPWFIPPPQVDSGHAFSRGFNHLVVLSLLILLYDHPWLQMDATWLGAALSGVQRPKDSEGGRCRFDGL
jgi:glucosamine-6-phosphate deaminase